MRKLGDLLAFATQEQSLKKQSKLTDIHLCLLSLVNKLGKIFSLFEQEQEEKKERMV